jgi:hypothetical protein
MFAEAWAGAAAVSTGAMGTVRKRCLAGKGERDGGGNTKFSDVRHNRSPEGKKAVLPTRHSPVGILRTTAGSG